MRRVLAILFLLLFSIMYAGIFNSYETYAGKPGFYSGEYSYGYNKNTGQWDVSKNYSISNLTSTILPGVAVWVASFLAAVAVLFLIVAGLQFLTAGGDPEQISKATRTAFYVLAGVLLVMFAYAIVYLFISIFTPT